MSEGEQTSGEGQGQPDDSEPSPERQAELETAYETNVAAGNPPYKGVKIRTRGELRWMMEKRRWSGAFSMPEGYERANLTSVDLSEANLTGADLNEANLTDTDLSAANLANTNLSRANLSGVDLRWADLTSANLSRINLTGADLMEANLTSANLRWANLTSAEVSAANLANTDLRWANLTCASLRWANLTCADLSRANLTGVDLLTANLTGATLSGSRMDVTTELTDAILNTSTRLADVIWNNAPLTHIAWEGLPQLGDEVAARQPKDYIGKRIHSRIRLYKYKAAVRSYRQLAVALRDQGLNEDAGRFAYCGQLMQRIVLRRRHRYLRYIGSLLLDLLAGYGYRPGRAILLYLAIILWFADFYVWASHGIITFGLPRSQVQPLAWYEALILSVSSFHGRGFQPFQHLNDPVAALAGIEAVFGLILEITFIATFTQRFFGK